MLSGDQRTVPELISDAISQFSSLVRNEIALARAEISAKAAAAATGVGFLVGGALLVIPATVLLLMAIAAWLVQLGLNVGLAHLLAALLGFGLSGLLAYLGMARLKPENLKPVRTINELQRDVAAVKEQR